jgi:hypothetical protein
MTAARLIVYATYWNNDKNKNEKWQKPAKACKILHKYVKLCKSLQKYAKACRSI